MIKNDISLGKLKENIALERKIIEEMNKLSASSKKGMSEEEVRMFSNQINTLKNYMRRTNKELLVNIEKISLVKPLKPAPVTPQPVIQQSPTPTFQPVQTMPSQIPTSKISKKESPSRLEKLTLKRLGKKEKKVEEKKEKKPSAYVIMASKFFYKTSMSFIKKGRFKRLQRTLIKANLEFVPASYVSVMFFTTLLSFLLAILIFLFFLFFNLSVTLPFIIPSTDAIGTRLLKVFWILLVIPVSIFFISYYYPVLEKKSIESRINRELPFASIHMAAISGSMIDPTKIFSIVITTKEYPNIQKEFTKLMNEINIYGYDLVSALRNLAFNSPSMKLSEFFNGLATTITSGGDLPDFFEKRAQTLLFEHRLDMEKQGKAAETFMDIYISVVIAAPMIIMLLLIMMSISGLGITLGPGMITLVMVLGVTMINILFLTFLHLKQPQV
jgi:Flp pilus assembly protein TadB